MGKALHKLGIFAFTHAWYVVAGWVVIIGLLGYSASVYIKPTSSTISIPGTEAQKALDQMSELFPNSGKGSGRIVFEAPAGKKLSDLKDQVTETSSQFSKVNGVLKAIDFTQNPAALSKDGTIAYTQLQLRDGQGSITEKTTDDIAKVVADARRNGMQVEMGGDIIKHAPGEILGVSEIVGVVIALLVLVATLGSLVAAGMPIATALVTVGVSMAGLFSLSQVMAISSTTPVLAVMLGLAVGIDYSLFIINRYRTYVFEGYGLKDATARAIGTAGNAVIFAATTVVIALSALTVVQIPFMTTMGLAAAAAIAVAAIVAITLVPAMLRLAGLRIFSRRSRKNIVETEKAGPHENHHADRTTLWYRWGLILTKYPKAVVVGGLVLIAIIAWPLHDLKLGLPTDQYAATSTTERKAYDLLSKGFGEGFNGPLLVVVEGLPTVSDDDRTAVRESAMTQLNQQMDQAVMQSKALIDQQMNAATTTEEQTAVSDKALQITEVLAQKKSEGIKAIDASVAKYANTVELKKVADSIAKDGRVVSALPAIATADGTKGLIQIVPKTSPSDPKTTALINDLRDDSQKKKLTGNSTIAIAVTGTTALQNDINVKLDAALPVYLSVVIGLSFILLVIAFRSLLIPLKATLGFLLSVVAMFGALVAVFQWGWFGLAAAPGPIINFIPIIAIGILFGLAMDYEFFLVTSMHEAYRETKDAQRSVHRGFAHASKVVLAAAVIMVAVFTGFIFNHDPTVQAIGFALSFGIFIDAFVVRLTMVPAVMALLGKSAWWLPVWMDKFLPHISIEGEDEN
jgi:RND superfamily putative drug exporter